MRIILDAASLRHYPLAQPTNGLVGGTETYVKVLARGLAEKGHTVHLIAADADHDEQWAPNLFVWPEAFHPTQADVVMAAHDLRRQGPDTPFRAPVLVLLSNGVGAYLGDNDDGASFVDGVACFSECHAQLLTQLHPKIAREKCFITGLGVDLGEYAGAHTLQLNEEGHASGPARDKVPGRFFFSNDPARGLWHVLDIFEKVRAQYPEATLHIGYDFDRQFEDRKWRSNWIGEKFWEMRRRMRAMPGVVNLGALSHEQTIEQELECHLHVMPSDPPNIGSQIHGILQMECAAAGVPLVLSNTEAFPEVFGSAATILPLPGTYMTEHERRYDAQDWADVCLDVLRDEKRWLAMSRASRELAAQNTWDAVVANVDRMLRILGHRAGIVDADPDGIEQMARDLTRYEKPQEPSAA